MSSNEWKVGRAIIELEVKLVHAYIRSLDCAMDIDLFEWDANFGAIYQLLERLLHSKLLHE